ncbi:carbohydrate ABC transporter permease [Allonocardiopsis opalescens]|uniref:Carbohydrate ABC transporter membrane protein 1 (CUT1 family) n=1 Tax=Allonocardiopsis opalescens TaxID=1144618 RepID=A0A2T0PVX7_9ACTN|nr:sugar ABC transporter permease [Allonocardiopsis opalescens]PRX95696.1 carbohydrate ABC transporter membrane protein 1 (CUT1 family) [Allonocardiopsis opalescens]
MVRAEQVVAEERAAAGPRSGGRARASGGGRAKGRPPGRRPPVALLAAFILPALALYTVFIIYPLFSALQYSLFTWEGTRQAGFAGLDNFTRLFSGVYAERFWRAFGHNGLFFLGTMAVQTTLGLAFAVLLHRSRFGKRFLQTAYTLPYLVSPIVVGYLWSLMLSPQFGAVNEALRAVGLDALAQPWTGDPQLALPTLILVNTWQWIGFPMLLFSAALAGIPEEYAEAARTDGASGARVFWHVTLPLLLPAIGIVSVLTFIGNMNVLDLVYAMQGSQGAPAGATDVLGLLFYRTAFQNPDLNAIGQSSALAVVMFVFIFGVSIVATRVLRRAEERLR